MANVIIDDTYLGDIADAIRGKNGSLDTYTPAQMAAAISAIETGGSSADPFDEIIDLQMNNTTSRVQSFGSGSRLKTKYDSNNLITGLSFDSQNGDISADTYTSSIIILPWKTSSNNYYTHIWTPLGYIYSKNNNLPWWEATCEIFFGYNNSQWKILGTTYTSINAFGNTYKNIENYPSLSFFDISALDNLPSGGFNGNTIQLYLYSSAHNSKIESNWTKNNTLRYAADAQAYWK